MSKLLIDEPPHQLVPRLACAIGINEAIVVQQLHWLIKQKTKPERLVTIGDRVWLKATYAWLVSEFPYFSESTVKRTMNSLRLAGLLQSRSAENKMERELQWSINYLSFAKFERSSQKKQNAQNGQIEQFSGGTEQDKAAKENGCGICPQVRFDPLIGPSCHQNEQISNEETLDTTTTARGADVGANLVLSAELNTHPAFLAAIERTVREHCLTIEQQQKLVDNFVGRVRAASRGVENALPRSARKLSKCLAKSLLSNDFEDDSFTQDGRAVRIARYVTLPLPLDSVKNGVYESGNGKRVVVSDATVEIFSVGNPIPLAQPRSWLKLALSEGLIQLIQPSCTAQSPSCCNSELSTQAEI